MKLLLDTHVALVQRGRRAAERRARALIEDDGNEKLVSAGSLWELAIKISLGKYVIPVPFAEFVEKAVVANGFSLAPIEPRHAAMISTLLFHHRAPFDRMIVAQAIIEECCVVSVDEVFDLYQIKRLWK